MASESALASVLRQEIREQTRAELAAGLGDSALREELAQLREAVERLAREQASPGDRLITLRQLLPRVGLGRSSIYLLISNDPTFPKPLQILDSKLLWRASEIDDWIRSRRPARAAS